MSFSTIEPQRPEDIAALNEEALRRLVRSIELSRGKFSLILVRCNYKNLQQQMLQQLRTVSTVAFREVVLSPSADTLHTGIKSLLGNEQPSAVAVLDIEEVKEVDNLLTRSNQVRDRFRIDFSFPLMFWVNDIVLQKLVKLAPDFNTWAGIPIQFLATTEELIQFLQYTTDQVFTKVLQAGTGKFIDSNALNLAIGSQRRVELEAAIHDLESRGIHLEPELEASLDFVLGRDPSSSLEQAHQYYQKSLEFWQHSVNRCLKELNQQQTTQEFIEHSNTNSQAPNQDNALLVRYREREGCLLYCLGLWHRTYAVYHRSEYTISCQRARDYYQQSLQVFQQANRSDLEAKFINALEEVLQRLEQWDELETTANLALELHTKIDANLVRQACDYGFLAEVALAQSQWRQAQQYAEKALEILSRAEWVDSNRKADSEDTSLRRAQRYHKGWYLLLLAEAQRHIGQIASAIRRLETAKEQSSPEYDPLLYIRILESLRTLYFNQQRYQEAFELKLERRSVQQQYGLRAFVGAGRLRPQRQVTNPALVPVELIEQDSGSFQKSTNLNPKGIIAEEITTSGRQQDIDELIKRISRTDQPLIVLYGQSGVGKSSLVQAGLLPSLAQKTIEGRQILSTLLRVYQNWEVALGERLTTQLRKVREITSSTPLNSPSAILEQLRQNGNFSLLSVLIFDQFEEFFFIHTDSQQRLPFFEFLQACLNLPYVKVILSLREDYLHYLLEWERLTDLSVIDKDILNRERRYYIGNFNIESARSVIRNLTERSQFYLEPALIEEIVRDLAVRSGEIRPIELQIVGAQLQVDNITTLKDYQTKGPKERLVERSLEEVIKDCGSENNRVARLLLYLLTDDNLTRPFKTRPELITEASQLQLLEELGKAGEQKIDLVLTILVKSGLVFLLKEVHTERYQLVHDYLVSIIRQQKEVGQVAQIQQERSRRKQAEQYFKRLLIGTTIILSLLTIWALQNASDAKKAKAIAEGERNKAELGKVSALTASSEALFVSNQAVLDPLLESLRAGKQLNQTKKKVAINQEIEPQVLRVLQQSVYSVRELNRLEGHTSGVNYVSFSPDRKTIATASTDNTIRLWNLNGRLLNTLEGHKGAINSLSFSPDGQKIASASSDQTVKIWNLNGKVEKTISIGNRVETISFDPSGQKIASGGWDNVVRLWTIDGKLLHKMTGHLSYISSVTFSPDGKVIASASDDSQVKLWNLEGQEISNLKGHEFGVRSVAFSPNGRTIATASGDKIIQLWSWDGRQAKLLRPLKGHEAPVRSIGFSPDSQWIVSGSADKTVRLWSIDGTPISVFRGHTDEVLSVSFSRDGGLIASASWDKTVKLWNRQSTLLNVLVAHKDTVSGVSFSPDGKLIATASTDNTVKLWNLKGQVIQTISGDRLFTSVSFSPNGQSIATASADNTARLWSLNGQLLNTLQGHRDPVLDVSFSPDGKLIATASADNTVKLWQLDGTLLRTMKGHLSNVNSVSFSPNGKTLASASSDKTVKLWAIDGKLLKTLGEKTSAFREASFSPNGKMLATASEDNTVILWDVESGKKIRILKGHLSGVQGVRFSPNGKIIATASSDNTVRLWNLDGTLLKSINEHENGVSRLSFSPDGKMLATASADKTVKIWNAETLDFKGLMQRGCNQLRDYLSIRSLKEDRNLCQEVINHQ
ncbi:MAG: hypothetical protein DCF22_15525 [Leptolyngbya sp.]|nr:MAG: hypothetical protein DCF22_15525 [Leptolyngbya sp.]